MRQMLTLLLVMLVVGELTECGNQNICMGEVIKDRVIIEQGDFYDACTTCTCTLMITDAQGSTIVASDTMSHIGAGYYGYQINVPEFYPDNSYTAYVSCTDGVGEVGTACIDFQTRDCYENEGIAGTTDAPIEGSTIASDSDFDLLKFVTDQNYRNAYLASYILGVYYEFEKQNEFLFKIISIFLNAQEQVDSLINYFSTTFLNFIVKLVTQPEQAMWDVILWAWSTFKTAIYANFIVFIVLEVYIFSNIFGRPGKLEFFTFINDIIKEHYKVATVVWLFLESVWRAIVDIFKVTIQFASLVRQVFQI